MREISTLELLAESVNGNRLDATRLRAYQHQLDIAGNDRDVVAKIAGSLLDLAQHIERRADDVAEEVKRRAAGEA